MVHHLRLEVAEHAAQVALDDLTNLGNHGVVVGFGNQALAGAVALVDVVVEADLVLAFLNARLRQRCAAGAHLVDLSEQVEQDMRRAHRGIRAEIIGAVVHLSSRQEHTRKSLFLDTNPRVCLVVLQHDVVARLVLLDHRVLKQQSLGFGVDDAVFEVGNLAHEDARLARLLLVEIAADATLEVLGLAHIDERAVFIEIAVHARLIGQRGELLFHYFGQFRHLFHFFSQKLQNSQNLFSARGSTPTGCFPAASGCVPLHTFF